MPTESSAGSSPDQESIPSVSSPLLALMTVIRDRKKNPPPRSYTTKLFAGGVPAIGAKIMEEAAELVEAGGETDDGARAHVIHEAADLVYHLLVLLGYKEIEWHEIEAELARRAGMSGLDEKASRNRE
jgi:phosphoribosyl-ATP pyrophosphohydrolase